MDERILVGTSGWHYADWRDTVYPKEIPQRRWLSHLAGEFATVELNNSFYRLPDRARFEAWADEVPAGFVFAVKASRYLTHVRRLSEPAEPVTRLLRASEGLGDKGGLYLVQLPPNLVADPPALDAVLAAFGRRTRVAVEFRHPSWESDDTRRVLERHQAACCWADRRGWLTPRWRTADWGYVRFHQGRAHPDGCYGRAALRTAAHEIEDAFPPADPVYVYFNNDHLACAVHNARSFRRLVDGA